MTKAEVTGGWITTCQRENCQWRKCNTGLNGGVSSPSTFAILSETGSAMCVSYASHKCFTVIGLWSVGLCDGCRWPAHTMQQLLDRFVFRIGPTTVAFIKSTDDDRLWCAHTMRRSSFRRLCVQQKTKIAWCVPTTPRITLVLSYKRDGRSWGIHIFCVAPMKIIHLRHLRN